MDILEEALNQGYALNVYANIHFKALSALPWAHISKRCFASLFGISFQIFVQYVNEFLYAVTYPVPVIEHFVF